MPSRHDSARAWDARSSRVVVIFRADASTNSRYRTSAVNRESRRAPTSAAASSRFAVSKDRFWTSAMSASTGADRAAYRQAHAARRVRYPSQSTT